ncbi:MAG: extracellular solute-binding protein, partial [Nocardioidaceae bacterium]|nr:extracellular solute-binding protein [Nocardioidaceae bacterium]
MRRQPRLLGALAAVVLLAAAAAGCGSGSQSPSAGSTITVSHGYTDVEAAALKKQVAQWNSDHPDQKVKLAFNGGNDSALQKIVAGFTAGNFPDASYQYGSSAAQLARQPKLVDLTDTVQDPYVDWEDFYPSE